MTEITHNMNTHLTRAYGLKKEFIRLYKTNDQAASDVLMQLRKVHGCVIGDSYTCIQGIITRPPTEVKDEEWVRLSANASICDLIHHFIKKCEKMAFLKSGINPTPGMMASDSDLKTATPIQKKNISTYGQGQNDDRNDDRNNNRNNNQNDNMRAIIRNNENTDELSIQNIRSESATPVRPNASDLFSTEKQSASTPTNTTEYINMLSTEGAERMYAQQTQAAQPTAAVQSGGHQEAKNDNFKLDINKPTLVNFWADWCGYSKKFYPTWQEFKEKSKTAYPNLQVSELNVGKDKELDQLAKKVGVNGYPTLVLFNNDKKDYKVGNSTLEEVNEFVNGKLGKKTNK